MFLAHVWSIFQILGAKNFFQENSALSRTTSYGFLAPYQNLEKNNDTIPRKGQNRRRDRRTYGQTLFHSTVLATVGGPKKEGSQYMGSS